MLTIATDIIMIFSVRLSVSLVRPAKAVYGIRCCLANTLVWPQVTSCHTGALFTLGPIKLCWWSRLLCGSWIVFQSDLDGFLFYYRIGH